MNPDAMVPTRDAMASTRSERRAVCCDLDGVVWLGDTPIPGAAAAVAAMRAAGLRVLFVTNNSFGRAGDVEAKLARHGIDAVGDVVTSAMAGALLVEPGSRALVLGGPGVIEELQGRGVEVHEARHGDPPWQPDAVVVGFHRWFDYEAMRRACTAVRSGALLVGTNTDTTFPTAEGVIPGGGAILAGVAAACGVEPAVAGKPFGPMAEVVRARVGAETSLVMVGDRVDTDGWFARTLGCPYALVLTGVTSPADAAALDPAPWLVAADLGEVATHLTGRSRPQA